MREIKFRAWDKKNGKMIHPSGAYGSDEYWQIENANGQHWGMFHKMKRICGSADGSGILMQYTGLRDKNKRMIFEGDILEFNAAEWGATNGNIAVVCFNSYDGWQALGSTKEWGTYCSIIGNIHENPELVQP